MLAGFIPEAKQPEAIAYIKKHILNCFPNNLSAPRLSDPAANNPQLITPYFSQYAFQLLIEQGETEFVLDQFRKCWGWALEDDKTTWIEVFDTRWSNCHQWSGSPTWIMSRYLLGLYPRFDLGTNHLECRVSPGNLKQASGKLPLPDGSIVEVSWVRNERGTLDYTVNSSAALQLHLGGESSQPVPVQGRQTFEVKPFVTAHTINQ